MGRNEIAAVNGFERQLHVLLIVFIYHIAAEVVDFDKPEQRQILVLFLVLYKVRSKSPQFHELVQFGIGKQVDDQKEECGKPTHGSKIRIKIKMSGSNPLFAST